MDNTLTLSLPFVSKCLFTVTWRAVFKVFLIFSILSTAVFLVIYVFQTNREVSERYLIKEYEKKIDNFAKENQNLEIDFVKANSLDNITALISKLNFEETGKLQYIHIINNQVVAK